MELIDVINKRRSIRSFQNKIIPRSEIEKIISLATKAPSSKNSQPWKIVAIDDENRAALEDILKQKISKLIADEKHARYPLYTAGCLGSAATVLLVFRDTSNINDCIPEKYKLIGDVQSIGAMIQTLILAAENMGYGSLWACDIFMAEKEVCTWLNIDLHDMQLMAAVALGYKNENPGPRPRKKIADIISWL